jgi:inhibitor of cysteine peptidase
MGDRLKFSMGIVLLITFFSMQSLVGREMVRVNENENGETVHLEVDEALDILLESNPTTGYQWNVDQLDSKILTQGPSDFIGTSSGLGSGGNTVLHFTVLAKGQTVLRLVYRRPFEKGLPPLKSFTLNIVVNGD